MQIPSYRFSSFHLSYLVINHLRLDQWQSDREDRTTADIPLTLHGAFMRLRDLSHQMQVRLFGIILNLLKEMRHDIFGDADALVDHSDDSIASLSFRKDLHRTVRRLRNETSWSTES